MEKYLIQIIASVVCILILPLIKYVTHKLIRTYAKLNKKIESRTNQVVRIISISINLLFCIFLIVIWGVDPHNLLIAISSVFAVIGVALFAQWSLLSNITAGIIIFFTSQFRIGDYIRILDKDMAFDARVEDIMSFHTVLITKEGETIIYPNSLFFQKGLSILHITEWDDEVSD